MEFGPDIVREDDFLTPEECAQISQQVLKLEPHWEARLGPYHFATLGCAAYLDVDENHYQEKSTSLNPLLRQTFGHVYERVRLYFTQLLQETAYYDEAYSYPGFHLFQFEGHESASDHPAERSHFDYQFAKIFPDFASTYLAPPLTFTLPIQEPSCGSSLEMWDLRPEGHARINYEHKEYARTHPSRTVHYAVGRIFTHDGLNLHAMGRIAPGTVGRRITLQGHAYKTQRGWLLYW
ncbi:hypothetical protein JST97_36880 [bacterium]|nr:hypothetical protein [bacterium]